MLVTYFVDFRELNDHLFGKELFIQFTASAFRKLRSIYVFSYFPFGFEGRMWDLIVSVPDHCLSFHFGQKSVDPRISVIGSTPFAIQSASFGPIREAHCSNFRIITAIFRVSKYLGILQCLRITISSLYI